MLERIPEPAKKRYAPQPIKGKPVQVQCDGYNCVAYLDLEGRWVDLFSRQFVSRVLGVISA